MGSRSSIDPFASVYVGNLTDEATPELLTELFAQSAPIASVHRPAGASYAFVTFATEDGPAAIVYAIRVYDGLFFAGSPLKVQPMRTDSTPGLREALDAASTEGYFQFAQRDAVYGPTPP